jgi:uncharacterized repeat protein (TIGR03803 family)
MRLLAAFLEEFASDFVYKVGVWFLAEQSVVNERGGAMLQRKADWRAEARRATVGLFITVMGIFLFLASVSQAARAQTYKVIHHFTNQGTDGANPYGGPVLDSAGNLYGTTYLGGYWGDGAVYKLSPSGSSWTYTSLYNFFPIPDGAGPGFGSLAMGPNGALYGTTESGGGGYFGTVFEICNCTAREVQIHAFGYGTDGAQPLGGVVRDAAGNLYGTTSLYGTLGNGTVFEEEWNGSTWTESTLYNFTGGDDGASPPAGVTLDAHGDLYGTTSFGGKYYDGVIYKLTRRKSGWKQSVLHAFRGRSDGQYPVGGVVVDEAGNLFGTTFDGGVKGGGTVYEYSPSAAAGSKFKTLYSFAGAYGGPYNKLTLANGKIYGFTEAGGANGWGSIWVLTPAEGGGWTFTDLHDFTSSSDGMEGGIGGAQPYGSVAVDSNGNIFGTTVIGGSTNQGVVFEITP